MRLSLRSMILSISVILTSVLPRVAEAQDGLPSGHYAHGSVSLMGGNDIVVMASTPNSGVVVSTGAVGFFGLAATVRLVFNHFLIQPSLGVSYIGPTSFTGPNAALIRPGIGLGGAVAITPIFSLSPMFRAEFNLPTTGGGWLIATFAELPFTVHIGRNGIIEPYIDIGSALTPIGGGPVQASFLFAVGYRLGVTF